MMKKMGMEAKKGPFLVVGCGSIGRRHIANLIELGEKDIVAFDANRERSGEAGAYFGIDSVDDLDSVWEKAPRAAFITTPTSTHIPCAIQAAEHGCHLFIEKPLSDTLAGAEDLLKLVEGRGLVSLVGCNMRFHPGVRKIKELIDEKGIGNMIAAKVEVGKYLPDWRPQDDYRLSYSARRDLGGGVILDAIHELDYIRWLLGDIDTVACFAGKLSRLEIETEDTAAIILRFSSGVLGEVHLDYVQRASSRSCKIIGDEGTIHWDSTRGTVRHYTSAAGEWVEIPHTQGWDANMMYLDEIRHFLSCIAGREQSIQDVREGLSVLRVALAAKVSDESKKVVHL